MKEIKAWAVVDETGRLTSWDGNYSVARTKKDTENWFIESNERVVRVTIRVEE